MVRAFRGAARVGAGPFERLAEHRGTDGGSGLGLAIVSRVVKQHHGQLQFVDEADGGFRVRILLPLTSARYRLNRLAGGSD
jgi:signal transduction histidine kinase